MGFTSDMVTSIMEFYNAKGNAKETLLLHDVDYGQVHLVRKSNFNSRDYLVLLLSLDTSMLQIGGVNSTNFEFYFDDRDDEVGQIALEILSSDRDYILKDRTMYILRQSTIYPELRYLVHSPYETDRTINRQYYLAGILFAVLTVLGLLAALLVTRKIYKPIGTVISRFGEDDDDMKQDEFAFLEKVTYDIMTANDELQTTIDSNQIDLRTKLLRDTLYGITYDKDMSDSIREFNLDYLLTSCRVVLIELHELDTFKSDYLSETRAKVRQNVHTILQNTLTLEGLFFDLVELNHGAYALIVGEWQMDGLKLLLGKLLKAIKLGEQVDVVMAIGDEVEDYKHMNQSYQQAQSVLDYKQSFDKRAIVTIEDVIDTNIKEKFYYPLEVEKDLLNSTLNGNIEKISVIFENITHINIKERQLHDREKNSLLLSTVTTLRRIEQKKCLWMKLFLRILICRNFIMVRKGGLLLVY